jgi:hypothetical protein
MTLRSPCAPHSRKISVGVVRPERLLEHGDGSHIEVLGLVELLPLAVEAGEPVACQVSHDVEHFIDHFWIERGGRFVKQHNPRLHA